MFEVLDYELLLKVYPACATGVGKDEGGYYLAIVLLNEENETAELNAKLLEQRIHNLQIVYPPNEDKLWIDLIDEFSIECKGRLTIAKLYGEVVTCWNKFQILGTQPFEPLLITE